MVRVVTGGNEPAQLDEPPDADEVAGASTSTTLSLSEDEPCPSPNVVTCPTLVAVAGAVGPPGSGGRDGGRSTSPTYGTEVDQISHKSEDDGHKKTGELTRARISSSGSGGGAVPATGSVKLTAVKNVTMPSTSSCSRGAGTTTVPAKGARSGDMAHMRSWRNIRGTIP